MHSQQPIWTRSFIFLFIASLLVFTAFYLMLPTFPVFLVKSMNMSTGYTGIIMAVFTVSAVMIRPITGFLIDLHGRKWFYLAGLFLFAAAFSGYMIAVTLAGMILVRALHGLVWGVTTSTGSTLVVDLLPPLRRGEGLGYYGLAGTIPMALGPMLGLWLVSQWNYDWMFIASIVLALIGFSFAIWIKFPQIPKHDVVFSMKGLIESKAVPVAVILFLNMITYGGLVSFISLYIKETGTGNAGVFFFVYALGITISRLIAGRIFDKRGPRLISITAFILVTAGFLVLAYIHNPTGFITAALVMGFGGGVLFPTCQAMVNNLITPNRRGAANSTLFTILDLGIGTGMMLTGYLAGVIGLSNAFVFCSFLNLVALVLFMTYSMKHYHRHMAISISQD